MLTVNTNKLKEFIGEVIDNNKILQEEGKRLISLEVKGPAGLGKTSAILQVCEEKQMDMIKINLAQIEEIGDLVGFPVKEFEICSPENECIWADEVAYTSFLSAGYKATGRHRMAYAPPEWIQGREAPNGGVLLLDDWTRADMRFIQACMELIDRQTYISWSLPKGWTVLLTSNPENDADYIVSEIDMAQKTRYMSLNLKFDKKCWAEWAEGKVDGRCINFVLMNEEVVKGDVNPRVLEMFFNAISAYDSFEDNLVNIQMYGEASIGTEAATLFSTFINNKLDKLIAPEVIFEAKKMELVPMIMRDTNYNTGIPRPDIASVLTMRFINYIGKYAESNTITPQHHDAIEEVVLGKCLGEDNNFNLIKSIYNANKRKFATLIQRPEIMQVIQK